MDNEDLSQEQIDIKESKIRIKENGEREYYDGNDWKLYNPQKYLDPEWNLDLE